MKAWFKKARATLEKCPSVEKVTEKRIVYTNKFKESAVKAYKAGKSPSEIFLNTGLDPHLFSRSYCSKRIIQWTKSYDKFGSLSEERRGRGATGRPKGSGAGQSPKTAAEIKTRLAYLEAENDFLKKLHALVKQGK